MVSKRKKTGLDFVLIGAQIIHEVFGEKKKRQLVTALSSL